MFLGFIRDILVAYFFGTSAVLEAFIVAFRLPNLMRSVFAEGFSHSVATPILSECRNDKQALFKTGSNLLSLSAAVLLVFSLIGVIFAKFLVGIIALGFISQPEKFDLAVSFARMTFFYLFFIGISVNSISILESLRKFLISSITPAFLNIAFIVGLLFFVRFFHNYILAICVLAGGVLQVIVPLAALRREGFVFRFSLRGAFKDSRLVRMIKLFGPRIASSIIYQLSVIIDTIFASFTQIVGEGALAALWFANRYIHFPLALFVHAISRVAIVDLSYYHSRANTGDFKKLFVFSFQNIIFFIVPVSFLYIFMSRGIIDVVLYRGDFNFQSLLMTSSVLFYYSFGLFFFCGIKLMVNTFYALKDTAGPAKVTALTLLINIILSAILMFPLKIAGVALGSSLSAVFCFFILYRRLVKKIGPMEWKNTFSQFLRVFLLSLILGVFSRLAWDNSAGNKYLRMALIICSGVFIFLAGGYLFELTQIRYLKQWLQEKLKRR